MKAVVVIAFYVWLALTVAIVLGRLARWSASRSASKRRRKARLATQTLAVESITNTPRPQSNPPISVTPPSIGLTSSSTGSDSAAATASRGATRAAAPASTEPPDRRNEERRRGDRRHADRREPVAAGTDSPNASENVAPPAPDPQPVPSEPTVAHLLAGFAMPADLTPVTPAGGTPNDRATSLISRDREAYDVGTNIADELERLGYSLQPVGETQLLATRDSEQLSVMIDPEPHTTVTGGGRRFPTANAGDVVVEFWVGSGARSE